MSEQEVKPQPLAIHKPDPEAQPTPLALIAAAVQSGLSPEHLRELYSMQERHERVMAAARFGDALAAFQKDCPVVPKTREAKDRSGNVMYKYASLEDCERVARPHLARHGISYSFEVEEAENRRTVAIRLQVGGHCQDRSYPFVTAGKTPMMDDAKQYASSLSQAKRHAFCAALGVTVADEEEEGPRHGDFVDGDQAIALHELLKRSGADLGKFFAWATECCGYPVETVGRLPSGFFGKAEAMLKNKVAQRAQAEKAKEGQK